ncbi:TIGR04222 domain-containing membrane protein [Amycolatopsis australiensis]|uniref:TIGR04222 domain-containing protein n=1 Tax=Amycolatopsis australiensis TaxID=546364 RepID=A0A1K1SY75_9PSEU|nr:TIGR04222 domain-containing membrane protein [Amycolatopsis australiensis]SFW89230.1 TIGR04222 domain-containing protein [Amycolatopsis australiensis]
MDDPWGISGPDFVVLYIGLLVGVLLVRVVVSGVANRRALRADAVQAGSPPTVYELAFLAGGPDRAADAAIAALVERGQLRVGSSKQISRAGTRPAEPLERAVFDLAKSATTATIRAYTRDSAAMRALEDGLDQRGLLASPAAKRQARTVGLVLQLAVLVLGVVRLVNGVHLGRPVGILVFLVLVAGVLTVVAAVRRTKAESRQPSAAGHRLLGQARSAANGPVPAGMPAGGVLLGGAAAAVALGGWAMYPDEELSAALAPPVTSFGGGGGSSSSGSSCSSSSCSSGSSCGSSCGGGGCGG